MCGNSKKEIAVASGIFVIFRNIAVLTLSWYILFEEKNFLNVVFYSVGRFADVCIMMSFIGVCQLFNGIKVQSVSFFQEFLRLQLVTLIFPHRVNSDTFFYSLST